MKLNEKTTDISSAKPNHSELYYPFFIISILLVTICFPLQAGIQILFPDGGETLVTNTLRRIIWKRSDVAHQPESRAWTGTNARVDIHYSSDNGLKWTAIVSAAPDVGYYEWSVPESAAKQCLIRISDTKDSTVSDTSNVSFSIVDESRVQRDDLVGSWSGQGVYYKNSVSKKWIKIASPASLICCGDLDGDGTDDPIGNWTDQGGLLVRYSKNGKWNRLGNPADCLTTGDINGDGRTDLVGSWSKQGTFFLDSKDGKWVKLGTPSKDVACADLDRDGSDDLIGLWPDQGGIWVRYSSTKQWSKMPKTEYCTTLCAGDINGDGWEDIVCNLPWGIFYRDTRSGLWQWQNQLGSSAEQIACGDLDGDGVDDIVGTWPDQDGVWVKYSWNEQWIQLASTADCIAVGKMTQAIKKK